LFPSDKGIEGSFKNNDKGRKYSLVSIVEEVQWLCSQVYRPCLLSSYDSMFPLETVFNSVSSIKGQSRRNFAPGPSEEQRLLTHCFQTTRTIH
jgi:hypothetical protein